MTGDIRGSAVRPDEQSLLSWYRRLIRARRSSTTLRLGDIALVIPSDAPSGILAFVRRTPADQVLAIHNLTGRTIGSGTLDRRAPEGPPLVSTGSVAIVPGDRGWRAQLSAHASAAWRIRR